MSSCIFSLCAKRNPLFTVLLSIDLEYKSINYTQYVPSSSALKIDCSTEKRLNMRKMRRDWHFGHSFILQLEPAPQGLTAGQIGAVCPP